MVMPAPAAASDRILHLDGLRGVAIALVLVHHLAPPFVPGLPGTPSGYLAAALTLTYTGVDLFFVLSGYLIGGILLDQHASPRLLPAFYWRRAARILPLAGLCVTAGLGLHALGFAEGQPWPAAVYVFFGVNLWMAAVGVWGFLLLAPLWSLAIEEQFYLLAPWIIRIMPPRRWPYFFAALIVSAPLLRWGILAGWSGQYFAASLLPFCRMDSLGLGLLGAWIMRQPAARDWCRRRAGFLAGVFVCACLGCLHLSRIRAGNASPAMAAGGYTVVAVFYFLVLLHTELQRGSRVARTLAWAPWRLLGRYSYFIYLFHGMIVSLAVSLCFQRQFGFVHPTTWLQLGTGLAALLATAAASWHFLEQPLLAWTRRRAAY
jgi:peptidoglycan/LPS O-acetylase OafA/YrhL